MRFAGFVAAAIVAVLSHAAAGATLRVGGTQPPPALGNPYTGVGPPSSASWSAIFDGLTVLDENGALKPALAQSWQNTSPTTWVFHLRPGVTFQNGAVLNAGAVAATINYLLSPDAKRFFVSGELRMVSGARAIDDLTIEIATKTPDAILPTRLNLVMIVEPDHWKTLGPEGFGLAPIGTGPYRLKDWGRARGRTILEAFPGAWRGKGAAERVELLTIADAAARQQALAAAQIDLAIGLGPEEAAALSADGFRVRRVDSAARRQP